MAKASECWTTTPLTETALRLGHSARQRRRIEEYEARLAERKRQHLEKVFGGGGWRPCLHDQCPDCHGTGINTQGRVCIHGISCPCPKCAGGALR